MEDGEYSKELDIAVRVVHLACALCRRVQEGLLENGNAQVKAKDDDSPVTIADQEDTIKSNAVIVGYRLFSSIILCFCNLVS
uniref:Uncharacterized protein n=1 Tax=Cucumis sativus TaxID=3659 RepID=A0A0A0LDM4_CUCSA